MSRVEGLEARLDQQSSPIGTALATAQLCTDKLDGLAVGLDEGMAAALFPAATAGCHSRCPSKSAQVARAAMVMARRLITRGWANRWLQQWNTKKHTVCADTIQVLPPARLSGQAAVACSTPKTFHTHRKNLNQYTSSLLSRHLPIALQGIVLTTPAELLPRALTPAQCPGMCSQHAMQITVFTKVTFKHKQSFTSCAIVREPQPQQKPHHFLKGEWT